jgi:hypothetical protein
MTRCTRRPGTAAYRPGTYIRAGTGDPSRAGLSAILPGNVAMGSCTEVWQNALYALQQALVLSALTALEELHRFLWPARETDGHILRRGSRGNGFPAPPRR